MDSFMPYMSAIYGWKMHAYLSPRNFCCTLPRFLSRKLFGGGMEHSAFKEMTGLKDHHVVYSSYTAYLGESIPYTISLDHDREAVVISLRGTFSLADLVTDLMVTPADLESVGKQWGFDGKGHHAHSGMLQVASRIRLDIEKQDILNAIFNAVDDDYEVSHFCVFACCDINLKNTSLDSHLM
jgi:sn1-specific diacylglycerol lipase